MARERRPALPGHGDREHVALFRVTRNANTERDEERADDLLSADRERAARAASSPPSCALKWSRRTSAPQHRGMLAAELGLDEDADVFEADRHAGHARPDGALSPCEIARAPRLALPSRSITPSLRPTASIFHVDPRRRRRRCCTTPYVSFVTSVERFLREASRGPEGARHQDVRCTARRRTTKAIKYLIDAAAQRQAGRRRRRAQGALRRGSQHPLGQPDLEESGIHVTYGVVGLKTHCKVILVVRQDYDGLRRYAHVGTGNYHAGTARLYSDLGMLTSDPEIGVALTELLNYLTTGYKPKRNYDKLLVAPKACKQPLLDKIDRGVCGVRRQYLRGEPADARPGHQWRGEGAGDALL